MNNELALFKRIQITGLETRRNFMLLFDDKTLFYKCLVQSGLNNCFQGYHQCYVFREDIFLSVIELAEVCLTTSLDAFP